MRLTDRVPQGFVAVPLNGGDTVASGDRAGAVAEPGTLRACLLARALADRIGGRFIELGLGSGGLDTRARLGCLVDAAGRVVEWLRVVTHDVDGLAGSAAGARGGLTNATLETRWARGVEAVERGSPGVLVALGWERSPAPALFYHPGTGRMSPLRHGSAGGVFEVCRDDAALLARGLPAFTSSLHRYLWARGAGGDGSGDNVSGAVGMGIGMDGGGGGSAVGPFVAVTAGAPEGDARLEDVLVGVNEGLEPFNPRGGMMLARRLGELGLEDLIDVLGGGAWPAVRHVGGAVDLSVQRPVGGGVELAAAAIDSDRLFLGRQGRAGRLAETLHLKLRLLAEAIKQVRDAVARTGRPMFNLTPQSFEVEGPDGGGWVPRLWGAKVRLVDLGTAVEVGVGDGGPSLMMAAGGIGRGAYAPLVRAEATLGNGSLLIRRALVEGGLLEVEATLRSADSGAIGPRDLVFVHLVLGGERLTLHARRQGTDGAAGAGLGPGSGPGSGNESAPAAAGVRLRTVPRAASAAVVEAAMAAQGVGIDGVRFESVPMTSTPCDLHALAVLGVRTLLVGPGVSLAVGVDEVLGLASRLSGLTAASGADAAAEAVEAALMSGAAGRGAIETLGPGRLLREGGGLEGMGGSLGLGAVPPELWFAALGLLARMFPGAGPGSYCRDLSDAPHAAPQRVFDRPLTDLDALLVRTRSLMLIDWAQNREVNGVLRRFREGMEKAEGPAIPGLG